MGFWSDGAGERTARTHHEGVQANEAARQANRHEVLDRDHAYKTAMANYNAALAQERDWIADNRRHKLKEYDRECRAAEKADREPKYASWEDVPDLAGKPFVPAKPVVEIPVREPVKAPMGVFGFVVILGLLIFVWPLVSHFAVGAYVVSVFAVPAAWIVWIVIFMRKKAEAEGDPERLAALERWNPFTIALRVCRWGLIALWKGYRYLTR